MSEVQEQEPDVWFIKDISQIVNQLNELALRQFAEMNKEGTVTLYGN